MAGHWTCLQAGHNFRDCPKPSTCRKCQGNHPRPLCSKIFSKSNTNQNAQLTPNNSTSQARNNANHGNKRFNNYVTENPAKNNNQITLPVTNNIQGTSNEIGLELKRADEFSAHALQQTPANSISTLSSIAYPVLLKCVFGKIFNPNNPNLNITVPCLLDDGSTNSYILASAAQALKLNLNPINIQIGVFNQQNCTQSPAYSTQFGIQLINGRTLNISATTLNFLTHPLPMAKLHPQQISPENIPAELLIQWKSPIVLLGSDIYYDIEPIPVSKLPNGYHLVQTLLGPLIAGKSQFNTNNPRRQSIYKNHNSYFTNATISDPNSNCGQQINQFFSLENIGISEPKIDEKLEGDAVHRNFIKTIKKVGDRYEVNLPFRSDPKEIILPSNFGLAWGRLRSTINSLNKNFENLKRYDSIIKEQLDLGIIEEVKDIKIHSSPLHYLAHQPGSPVFKADKNKLRIVYDGSARESKNSPSLNDLLFPGPMLMNDLMGVLLRFRLPKIVVVCDIAKAFLQIKITPEHRDANRFLWLKTIYKPFSSQNIQCYRFTRVSFGLTCSPYLLAATITHHLNQYKNTLSKEIAQNIYVDNILFSAIKIDEAKQKCLEAINIFNEASMPLREFASNEEKAIEHLPNSYKLIGIKQKFLGISWDTSMDELSLALNPFTEQKINKRQILAFLASHYDPLGLLGPLLLPIEIFMQSLWAITPALTWDEEIPATAKIEWAKIIKNWTSTTISFPRKCFSLNSKNINFVMPKRK
uniref:Cbl-PTB domain-containing protein n=1 Tax=Meloidogyne enterolobii TaxID=390850 RepID=A0A6V7UDZ2_MELEN|nr:unnamed protein product [Meloidogyne enterolobii]